MKDIATITFVSEDRLVSEPIAVPLWSAITLGSEPTSPMVYASGSKMILHSGPWRLNGKPCPAPVMKPIEETQIMAPLRPVRLKRRARTVTVPLWLAITYVIVLYAIFGVMLWVSAEEILQVMRDL